MKAHAKWELDPGLRAEDIERGGEGWIVSAMGLGTAECPDCHEGSTRRHGWQRRRLQDLPVQGRPATLQVRVARSRCQNRCCERQTFTDRLPRAARPFARRTCRVAELARLVGHAAGGLPSERLLTRLGLPQRDDTVLRNLKRHAVDRGETSTARIVGIDDWGWQKGCRYGTIMVDHDRREVVDVLSDRSADSVARSAPLPAPADIAIPMPPTDVGAYTELQVCSNYSFLRGASRIEELLLQAKAFGKEALAITDHTAWPASPARMAGPRRSASGWSSAAASISPMGCPSWHIRWIEPDMAAFAARGHVARAAAERHLQSPLRGPSLGAQRPGVRIRRTTARSGRCTLCASPSQAGVIWCRSCIGDWAPDGRARSRTIAGNKLRIL